MGMRLRMSGENNHQYGLKGDKNASFKGEITWHKNHKLKEFMFYSPDHPRCDRNGRVHLHRLIVEKNHHLFNSDFFEVINGHYCLKKNYIVHHKDFNHTNNELSNLEVMTRGEHTRVHNLINVRRRDAQTGRFLSNKTLKT